MFDIIRTRIQEEGPSYGVTIDDIEWVERRDSLVIMLGCDSKVGRFLSFLKKSCGVEVLVGICGVDYPEHNPRYELAYILLSLEHNQRLLVKVKVGTITDSVVSVFCNAEWYERETWDMFGIMFRHHPDHRRILTDYGFNGHPLRKDFPVMGEVELHYDREERRIQQTVVALRQEFRDFDSRSPWQGYGAKKLPGDEKATV